MRSDLLGYYEALAHGPDRSIVRAERWRRRAWSTRRIAGVVETLAARLHAAGIDDTSRVGLYLHDGPLWVAAFYGVLRTGAIAVPLDVSIPRPILSEAAAQLDLAAWIGDDEVANLETGAPAWRIDWTGALTGDEATQDVPAPPPWPDPDAERLSQIVLTSGTSGVPQAVPVLHRNLRSVLDPVAGEVERYRMWLGLLPAGRIGVALPLSHLYGQVMGLFVPTLFHAHTLFIPALPGAELAQLISEQRISVLAAVPRTLATLARTLVQEGERIWGIDEIHRRLEASETMAWYKRPRAFARLRRRLGRRFVAVVSGGAALDRDVEDVWRRLGYVVIQGYGLTEAAPMVTLNHPLRTRAGSLGRALHGVQVEVAEDGEILVRGPNVVPARMGGAAVDQDGWLHTGDLGRMDDDGRLYYIGRKGDRIVTPAGVNVDPGPIVAQLRAHPGMLDALVLERPWGARGVIAAVILAAPGANVADAVERTNAALPDAARIRAPFIWPGSDFPRTHTEKIRRVEVRDWLATQAPEGTTLHVDARTADDDGTAPAGSAAGAEPRRSGLTSGIDSADVARDPFRALLRMISELTGDVPDGFDRQTSIADALTSLDRVELASMLEAHYGIGLSEASFAGERTLGDLADELAQPAASDAERSRMPAAQPIELTVAEGVAEEGVAEEGAARPETGAAANDTTSAPQAETAPDTAQDARAAAELPAAPPRATTRTAGSGFPEARWRTQPWARAARFVIRELVMRPGLHAVVDLRRDGVEHVRAVERPFLIVSNHLSIMDPVCLLFALPYDLRRRVASTAMWQHFERAPSGKQHYFWATLGLNIIPLVQVGDWRPTLRLAGQLVDRGYCPLIYPEGSRSIDGSLGEFKLGAAVLAQNLHLPIVPAAVAGLVAVLPRGAKRLESGPIPRPRVAVHFGAAIHAPRPGDDPHAITRLMRERVDALRAPALADAGRW